MIMRLLGYATNEVLGINLKKNSLRGFEDIKEIVKKTNYRIYIKEDQIRFRWKYSTFYQLDCTN